MMRPWTDEDHLEEYDNLPHFDFFISLLLTETQFAMKYFKLYVWWVYTWMKVRYFFYRYKLDFGYLGLYIVRTSISAGTIIVVYCAHSCGKRSDLLFQCVTVVYCMFKVVLLEWVYKLNISVYIYLSEKSDVFQENVIYFGLISICNIDAFRSHGWSTN